MDIRPENITYVHTALLEGLNPYTVYVRTPK